MEYRRKLSYKFSKIPRQTVEEPVAIDLSTEITKMFEINRTRKQRISEYMCDSIRKTRLKSSKPSEKTYHATLPFRPTTSKDLRKFSDKVPAMEMSRFQEKDIRNKIQAKALEKKYTQLLSDMMKETKQEFVKIVHYAGMNLKVKLCHPEAIFVIQPYKFIGKTSRYQEFLKIKKRFHNKWILHYPIVKNIYQVCVSCLPYQLFGIEFKKISTIQELEFVFKDKTQRASQFIYEFYLKILVLVEREEMKKKKSVNSKNYLGACTGLMSLHISKIIAHTILKIVKLTASETIKPYLSLEVYFENGLVLEPKAETVVKTYHQFLDKIIETGAEIYVLERNRVKGYENKYMRLCLTEEFINDCKENIRTNICKHYEPILKHLEVLNGKFKVIYTDINSEDFFESISDIMFDEGCKKINYYREYLHKVMFIPDYEFFKIGKMSVTKYRETLHDGLSENINSIFEKLCAQHLWEVNDLCESFSMIHIRANQKPLTTEEMIETGKYMTWIKTEHLLELNDRVRESLRSLCQIIDLGILTKEHMDLNSTAIQWLDDILPVIEEHAATFETLKFDAEERLQKVVEEVNDMIKDIYPLLVVLDEMDDIGRARSYLNGVTLHMTKIKEIEVKILWINKEEVCLSFPKSTYPEYEDLKNHIYPFYHLLKLCLEVKRNVSVWQDGPFEMLSYDSTSLAVEKFHKELTDLYKGYRKKLRQAQDDNVSLRFKGTVDDPDILNWPAPLKLCGTALKLIEDFKPLVRVMEIICNPTLSKRHWMAMSEIAGTNVTPNAGSTLRKMLQIDFQSQLSEYEIISTGASKEKQLKDDLDRLKAQWGDIRFRVTTHKDVDIKILADLDGIEAFVDDHTITVLNMRGSVFVKPHKIVVRKFYGEIQKIKSTIDNWSKVQNQLLKLYPIFTCGHLAEVLPEESKLFSKTVDIYSYFISLITNESTVIKIVNTTDIIPRMEECLTYVEIVDQGITKYLEILRENFPRLYFLTNDEISQIICNKLVLTSAQFFTKLFPGIHRLHSENHVILGVSNHESETLSFQNCIEVNENYSIENLCMQIEQQMKFALKNQMLDCYKEFKRLQLKELLALFCMQILEVVSQIYWTQDIEDASESTQNIKLITSHQKLKNSIRDKVSMSKDCITNLEKIKLRTLIVNDITNESLIKAILESNQTDINNFEWEAYIKHYYTDGSIYIKAINSKIVYDYEYQESSGFIISTPLTDKCVRALLNAYFMHYNGLVRVIDGTSIIETIRYLVRSFGGLQITYSCTRNLSVSTLNQFIKGSLLCGSWMCLENFHLIRPGVLSVISQELYSIQAAKKQNSKHCMVGGRSINLNHTSFICACVASSNYCNTFLPTNVKVLFRTVTMLKPDLEAIAETSLYSYGFLLASSLSKKICCMFGLLRDLMPDTSHYNYSIHTLKQILSECETRRGDDGGIDEISVVVGSIRKIFTSKVEEDDRSKFNEILAHVFPNILYVFDENTDVKKLVHQFCEQKNIQADGHFVCKVLEAYENIYKKFPVLFVGETYTGKTTMINLCAEIFKSFDLSDISCHFLNPNSLDYNSMYGYFNIPHQHWVDGIIAKLIRSFAEIDNRRNWLVFDGAIDSSWIENISSLLDEKGKFHCDSGEILLLQDHTTIIFEVRNLHTSSPSLISRCAVVYLHQSTIGWKSLVQSWVNSCTSEWIQEYQCQIFDLFCWIIPPCLEFIKDTCNQLCATNELNLVKNMILLTQMILDEAFDNIIRRDDDSKNLPTWIQATIIQAGTLGLGSILDTTSIQKFDEFYKLLWKGQITNHAHPKSLEKLEVGIPHEGLIYDYQYIYKQRGNWKLYQDILKTEKVVESPYMHDFLIPTVDTLRCKSILQMFVKKNLNVLFIGPSGTGKNIFVENALLNNFNKHKYEISQINFNEYLQPRVVQEFILAKLNKRKTGYFSPPTGKKFLLFIDNMNLVTMNKSGSSSCLDLLRQHMDHNVWYDFLHANEIHVDNMNLISAMGLVEGSGKQLCQRILRHFNIFAINELSEDTILRIYSSSLLHTWKKAGYPSDIVTIVNQIVQATSNVFKQLKLYCRPTLTRCHYLFSLNSFSKVLQGCSMLRKEIYDGNKKIYLKLWTHEIMRVFGDRLSALDNTWLQGKIKEAIRVDFSESCDDNFENGYPPSKIIFSTINDRDNHSGRRYEEITDEKTLTDKLIEILNEYNSSHKIQLEIMFFQYALEKLLKISRVLSFSPGNALLIGPCGSGRKNLTKLASYIYKYELFEAVPTEGYSRQDWNRQVKLVLKQSGALEHQCVFLVTEEQLIDEEFLQNIDHLLQNGEIPDLYDMEERQEILELARLSAQGGNRNLEISSSSVFHFFNKRCRENLHLILCLSSVGDLLRKRIRKYPKLMACYVIWWDDWPDESLRDVGKTWTANLDIPSEVREKIVDMFIHFHRDAQNNSKQIIRQFQLDFYVTPVFFTHLVRLFAELITKKQNAMASMKKVYLQGLAKLSFAARQISDMQKALADYQPQLAEMTQKAIEMTEQIALETIEVEKASALVRKDEKIASEQAIVAQILKSECESELAQAIPILEDAISALNTLKPSDITLVKSMKNPPDAIKLVMAAVCVIKDVKPDRIPDPSTGRKIIDYWSPSKRILGDMNFLQTLKDFDKDHIKPEIMVKIRKEYLPHKDFKPHVVAKASSAAEGLCKWIIAMDMYDKVAKEVAPKKEKLEKAEEEYAETITVLNQKKDEVERIEEKLASLKKLLDDATKKQLKLQREVDACNKKLGSAQKLIGSLGGEKIRWTKSVENLEKQEHLLFGNILISSAIIAYLAPFNDNFRNNILQRWHQHITCIMPCSDDFSVIKSLSSEADTEKWVQYGLPNDEFFFQNGVIHNFSKLYSLFIDPEYITEKWIRKIEKRNNLTVTKFTHDDYLEKLKNCILLGKPIMIHKIKETFPACLSQLILKKEYVENDENFGILNNEHLKIDTNFKLYLVSNVNYPQFPAELCNNITLINSSVTPNGLSQFLLKIVTEIEKPELKKKSKELHMKKIKNRSDLAEHENNILSTLCESGTDILEDEASIKILDQSKDLARIVREKQEDSKTMELVIQEFGIKYSDIASYAADLYSCVTKLQRLNYLYQFSLEWYISLYYNSVLFSEKSKDLIKRCENIKQSFVYYLYISLNHSLYKNDKLVFLILLLMTVMKSNKTVTEDEIEFFLKAEYSVVESTADVSEIVLKKVSELDILTHSQDISSNLDLISWKSYLEKPSLDNIPSPWNVKLTSFQKLILTKLLKPDHLYRHIQNLIKEELGEKFLETIYYNITDTLNNSCTLNPILFISTPEFNSSKVLSSLAEKKKVLHSFKSLSFGENEITKANNLIDRAQVEGSWVLLQNCHLAPNWFEILDRRLTEMDFDNTHENFRLWLTSEATEDMPPELLQNSIKVIVDTPAAFKENLMRLYKNQPLCEPEYFSGCPGKHEVFTKLLYGFACFQSALQQRIEFDAVGWITPYSFDDSDFQISLQQLQLVVNEEVFSIRNVEKILYLIGYCHYGGYLDNQLNISLVITLLQQFMNSETGANKNYLFSDMENYGLPKKCDYQDYINYISKLPDEHNPEIYGFNEFINTFAYCRKTEQVLQTVFRTSVVPFQKSIESNEFLLITSIDDILKNIPQTLNCVSVHNHIVSQEIARYNRLLDIMTESLQHLKLAIGGAKIISPDEEEIAEDILNCKVPGLWYNSAQIHDKNLTNFLKLLQERVQFFRNFKPTDRTFPLAVFFSPRAVISKAKLDFADKFGLASEDVNIDFEVLKNISDSSDDIVITELFLFGAKWDENGDKLIETTSSIHNALPPIGVRPVNKLKEGEANYFMCPVYQTADVKDTITVISLKTENPKEHWIKRGVMIVCQI